MSTIRHPVRQLRRTHQIGSTFARHGFGFAWEQLRPTLRARFRRAPAPPKSVPVEALAEHFRLALEELGPTFIKLGQVLSTRPDLLPPAYIAELSKLQDEAPRQPWDEISTVLAREYGRPAKEVFASIEHEPMAAASLAQVHAATLPDGAEVVVKVQRQGIRETIDTDLAIMADLAAGADLTPFGHEHDLPGVVQEFATTLRNEMDYRREGRNADRLRRNFAKWAQVYVPKVYWDYSTPQVLVLERIRGIKINAIEAMIAAGVDRKAVALYAAQVIVKEVLEDGFFHADPHPGNFVVMPGNVLGVMDFGMMGVLDEAMRLDLARLYIAAIEMSTDDVVDQLLRTGAVAEDVDRHSLARDISALLDKYRGITLKEIRASEVVADVIPIAFRHHLHLPSSLWLLGKTLSMLESVGLQLDPDFDVFAVSGPIVSRLMWRMIMPRRPLRLTMLRRGTELADMMELVPRAASRLLQRAERGDLFSLRIREAGDFVRALDRASSRLAISLVLAALIMGTAWLIPHAAGNTIARLLTIAGFVLSALMGVWLVISMLWPRRPGR